MLNQRMMTGSNTVLDDVVAVVGHAGEAQRKEEDKGSKM